MKLVEILARELEEWNPELGEFAVQDPDNNCTVWSALKAPLFSRDSWAWINGGYFSTLIDECSELAEDHATAIVTRAEWQAAVDALGIPEFSGDKPAWTGEGLPPVGTVCEVLNNELHSPKWELCTILFTGKYKVVYDSESCSERASHIETAHFRPLRTPEQIAAEERDKAIEDLYFTINWNEGRETWAFISSERKADYAKAIDAGYRKQPKK